MEDELFYFTQNRMLIVEPHSSGLLIRNYANILNRGPGNFQDFIHEYCNLIINENKFLHRAILLRITRGVKILEERLSDFERELLLIKAASFVGPYQLMQNPEYRIPRVSEEICEEMDREIRSHDSYGHSREFLNNLYRKVLSENAHLCTFPKLFSESFRMDKASSILSNYLFLINYELIRRQNSYNMTIN